MTKTGPTSALVGDTVRYVLTVQNAGPSAARTVTLTDTMPAQLTLLRATRGGAVSGGIVSWPAIDSMPPNTTVTDTAVAQVVDTGTVINIAATQSPRLDPDSTNQDGRNAASRITIQLAPPIIHVAVTPDGGTPTARLAGTGYSQPFTGASTSARWETFDLLLRTRTTGPGGAVVDSITGPGLPSVLGDSLRVTVPDSTTQVLTVWYTVPTGDTTTTRFVVTARATRDSAARDTAWAAVKRGAPELVVTKTVSPQTAPAPGTDLTYTSTVQNVGDFAAHSTVVEDDVPTAVVFKVGSVTSTLPAGITGLVTYSADGGATWSYTPVSGGCGAPVGYDACVRRIRVSLSADLSSGSDSTGQVEFVARIQ